MRDSVRLKLHPLRGAGKRRRLGAVSASAICAAMLAMPSLAHADGTRSNSEEIISRLSVVDCLLPGKVRQLGRRMRFIDRRQLARLPAAECEIRGGEYTVYDRANESASLATWMPVAMEGDANAQLIVGELSERGAGGAPDYAMARLWYERAADQGNVAAMFNLARVYEQGLGVPADGDTAASWYRQAYGLSANRLDDVVRIERMEGQIASLEGTVSDLRRDLAAAQAEKRALEEELRAREAELTSTSAEIAEMTRALAQARDATATAQAAYEAELATLNARLAEAETERAQVQAQEKSVATRIDALANRQIEASQALAAQLAQLPQLAAQSARLAALQSELRSARAEAQAAETAREKAVAAEQAARAATSEARAQLQVDLQRLAEREAQLAERETALAEGFVALEESGDAVTGTLDAERSEIADARAALAADRRALQHALEELEHSRLEQAAQAARVAESEAEIAAKRDALAAQAAALDEARMRLNAEARALEVGDTEQSQARASLQAEFDAIAEERARIADERARLQDFRSGLAEASMEIAMAEQKLTDRTAEIESRATELEDRERSAEVQTSELEALRSEAEEARRKLAALEAIISGNMRSVDRGALSTAGTLEPKSKDWNIDFGAYHAILIGNANYDDPNWQDLDTPHNDVQRIGKILTERYGFNTNVLIDATREDILAAIEDARNALGDNDNLLIYYAGHGKYSEDARIGFWEPVDSIAYGYRNSISAQDINFYLSGMDIRKVLVISDSCYSGAFARDLVERLDPTAAPNQQERFYMIQAAKRSRVVMTAGGLKPVADGIGNGHSLFASAFINALLENDDIALSRNLFGRIRDTVISSAAQVNLDQEPSFADLVHTGHEGGDFIFVPKAL